MKFEEYGIAYPAADLEQGDTLNNAVINLFFSVSPEYTVLSPTATQEEAESTFESISEALSERVDYLLSEPEGSLGLPSIVEVKEDASSIEGNQRILTNRLIHMVANAQHYDKPIADLLTRIDPENTNLQAAGFLADIGKTGPPTLAQSQIPSVTKAQELASDSISTVFRVLALLQPTSDIKIGKFTTLTDFLQLSVEQEKITAEEQQRIIRSLVSIENPFTSQPYNALDTMGDLLDAHTLWSVQILKQAGVSREIIDIVAEHHRIDVYRDQDGSVQSFILIVDVDEGTIERIPADEATSEQLQILQMSDSGKLLMLTDKYEAFRERSGLTHGEAINVLSSITRDSALGAEAFSSQLEQVDGLVPGVLTSEIIEQEVTTDSEGVVHFESENIPGLVLEGAELEIEGERRTPEDDDWNCNSPCRITNGNEGSVEKAVGDIAGEPQTSLERTAEISKDMKARTIESFTAAIDGAKQSRPDLADLFDKAVLIIGGSVIRGEAVRTTDVDYAVIFTENGEIVDDARLNTAIEILQEQLNAQIEQQGLELDPAMGILLQNPSYGQVNAFITHNMLLDAQVVVGEPAGQLYLTNYKNEVDFTEAIGFLENEVRVIITDGTYDTWAVKNNKRELDILLFLLKSRHDVQPAQTQDTIEELITKGVLTAEQGERTLSIINRFLSLRLMLDNIKEQFKEEGTLEQFIAEKGEGEFDLGLLTAFEEHLARESGTSVEEFRESYTSLVNENRALIIEILAPAGRRANHHPAS